MLPVEISCSCCHGDTESASEVSGKRCQLRMNVGSAIEGLQKPIFENRRIHD
jgi:hypothetical protein